MPALLDSPPTTELLNREQAAEFLRVKPQTLAVWHTNHRYGFHLLAIHVGSRVRYRKSDLDAWLASRTGDTQAE